MVRIVDAIYTGGVLRPVETLDLEEDQRVRLTIEAPNGREATESEARRRAALARLFALMDCSKLALTGSLPSRDELHERR